MSAVDIVDRSSAEHYVWGGVCDGWHFVKRQDMSVIGFDSDEEAVRELTSRLETAIRDVTVNLERWEDVALIEFAEAVWSAELGRKDIEERHEAYVDLVRLLLRLGLDEEGFATSEKLRARSYLDLLSRDADPALSPGDRRRALDLGGRALRQILVHRGNLARGLGGPELCLDHGQDVGLDNREDSALLAIVLRQRRPSDGDNA